MSFNRDLDQNFNQNIVVTVGDNKAPPPVPQFPARPQIIREEKEEKEEEPRKSNFWKYLVGLGVLGGSAAYIGQSDKRTPFVLPDVNRLGDTPKVTPVEQQARTPTDLTNTEVDLFTRLKTQGEEDYSNLRFMPGASAAAAALTTGLATRTALRPGGRITPGRRAWATAILGLIGGAGGYQIGSSGKNRLIHNDRLSYNTKEPTEIQQSVRGR